MAEHGDNSGLVRVLGRLDVIAIAFGAMIGFGWIVLTGGFLEDAGSGGTALAFVLGGIVVGLVGLTYAELVSAMPSAGGEHNYTLRALGSRPAFVTSWTLVLGYVSVVAFEAVALPQTLLYLAPDLPAGRSGARYRRVWGRATASKATTETYPSTRVQDVTNAGRDPSARSV